MSAYGPKADHLGASATGPNMGVFEQENKRRRNRHKN
jgi:hypothetical protein